jgi:hypothetical protein
VKVLKTVHANCSLLGLTAYVIIIAARAQAFPALQSRHRFDIF